MFSVLDAVPLLTGLVVAGVVWAVIIQIDCGGVGRVPFRLNLVLIGLLLLLGCGGFVIGYLRFHAS